MRSTITLEPDVEELVRTFMREGGISFKEAVNTALRAALRPPSPRRRFRTPSYPMGEPRVPLTKALQLAGELEDDEIARKLSIGK